MIISKLLGGLGNQMFEYAFGRSLSLKYNVDLKLDVTYLLDRTHSNFKFRDYDLDIFNISSDVGNFNVSNIVVEPHFHFSQRLINLLDLNSNLDLYLDGFWQSYKYFQDYENVIKRDFKFKNDIIDYSKELEFKIKNSNSVMINVRRTDYLNNSFHGVMGTEFIMKGVEIIKCKVENPYFFIFSDDIDWCINNIQIDNMFIVDHLHKGYKFDNYLNLMKLCNHFITPNSTFSWWAAWLGEKKDKIVIAPNKWFTDSLINTSDLIPSDWIRI